MLALVVKLELGSFAGQVAVRVAWDSNECVQVYIGACSPGQLVWNGRGSPVMPLARPMPLEVFTSAWRLRCPRSLAGKDSDSSICQKRSAVAEPVERKCPSFLRLHGRSAAFAWLPLTVVLYGKAAFSRSNQKAVGFGLTEPNRSPGGHPAAEPSRALETAGGGDTLSRTLRDLA